MHTSLPILLSDYFCIMMHVIPDVCPRLTSIKDWIRFHSAFLMEAGSTPNDWHSPEDTNMSAMKLLKSPPGGNGATSLYGPDLHLDIPEKVNEKMLRPLTLDMGDMSMTALSLDITMSNDSQNSSLSVSAPNTVSSEFHLRNRPYSWCQFLTDEDTVDEHTVENKPVNVRRDSSAPEDYTCSRWSPRAFLGDEESVYRAHYFSDMAINQDREQRKTLCMHSYKLGGIHMPKRDWNKTTPLLLTMSLEEHEGLEHWITPYALSNASEANDRLPFEVQSMPVHNLVEGPDEETGRMCHGWFCSYILGYAVVDTYVPTLKQHLEADCDAIRPCVSTIQCLLSQGKIEFSKGPLRWGGRVLVLKQNMLFEYACNEDVFHSHPIGFLPLCGAHIEPLKGNSSALSIYAMRIPVSLENAKGAKPNKFIRVVLGAPNVSTRDLWLDTLQLAARLKSSGLYTRIDLPSNEVITTDSGNTVSLSQLESSKNGKLLGRSGLCTTIYLAKRNVPCGGYCAIKKVKTKDFFLAVSKNMERFDALMREVLLQSILSVRECPGDNHPIVPLRGVFETEQAVFIEMELMSNVDLFDRISTVGVSSFSLGSKQSSNNLMMSVRIYIVRPDQRPFLFP